MTLAVTLQRVRFTNVTMMLTYVKCFSVFQSFLTFSSLPQFLIKLRKVLHHFEVFSEFKESVFSKCLKRSFISQNFSIFQIVQFWRVKVFKVYLVYSGFEKILEGFEVLCDFKTFFRF